MIQSYADNYTTLLWFILIATGFLAGGLLASWIVRPNRPNEEKNQVYECGEDAVGGTYGFFNFRFYALALAFVLFEAEVLFLFPWAVVMGDKSLIEATGGSWAWFCLLEIFLFIFILLLGLVYAWKKGMLEWEKPSPEAASFKGPLSEEDYLELNKQL